MKKVSMKIFICVIFLSFGLIWPGPGIADKSPDTLYNEGTEFLRTGDLSSAKVSFTSAINLLTGTTDEEQVKLLAEAYNNRGLAYYKEKDYSNAETDFKASEQKDSTNIKAKSNLALVYFVQELYAQAKTKYEEALPSDSTKEKLYHADVYNNLGVCCAQMGLTADAMVAYNNAIRISKWDYRNDPNNKETKAYTDAYFNRGNLYYSDEKYDLAEDDYGVTIEYFESPAMLDLEPQPGIFDRAYHNRALCYYNKGMYQEAINDYIKALEVNPDYAWAHYGKGYAHFMLDQNDTAIAEYTIINTAESGINYWAQFGLGLAWCKKGDFDKGLAYLKQSCDEGDCPDACDFLQQ
ncbi:MAG: tetratricopeptide repeat protein, partial [Deltaproteobacteria bacterium]|nr:tetratricopeptide repeat protein [Deltaproteobacteria bacterium]